MKRKSFWKPRKIIGGLLWPLVLLAILPAPANAYPRPGITERVSVATGGAQANSDPSYSSAAAVSADGRHVAFPSFASNLVPGDTNGAYDLFVHDRTTGTTERVSLASDGAEANDSSSAPAISADGRYVAFQSRASNLVAGDTNGAWDVFVHDRATGVTERVSLSSNGGEGSSSSYYPAVSADGRHIAFYSFASNLVAADTNGALGVDVFVHDLATGTTERVSLASGGAEADDRSLDPAISADGRHVAFYSYATNLVSGDSNGSADVFVHDRATGTTERVSVASDGAEVNAGSFIPTISADGRHIAFESYASNLVPADTNVTYDVFVHDRLTEGTERVSVASDGTEAEPTSASFYAAISADGRHVAFQSYASNLVPGDTNVTYDMFVHDRATGATERVSVAPDGADANSSSFHPTISPDGRYVAFPSFASNLAPGDTNGSWDVFVRDRGAALGVVGTPSVVKGPKGLEVSGRATFAGATFAKATDPADDGSSVGPARAGEVGAELTGAALIYRPEQEDLLLRLDLSTLPPVAGSLPGVVYGMGLRVGEMRYEVRALRAAATSTAPRAPHVVLYRCDVLCTEHAALKGSFGTTGEQVLVSVRLSALGVVEGTELTALRAFTALGEAAPGGLHLFDEVPLSPSAIPTSRVELGIAPASTPEDGVALTADAYLYEGDFSGSVSRGGLSPGSYRVWARACLGDACGPAEFGEVAL